MDRWKAEVGRVREEKRREEEEEIRSGKRKSQKTEDAGAGKGFQLCGAPEGRKGGSLKRRVRSHLGRWEMKSCTPLWREAHFQVKMHKTHHARTTFGSRDVKKLHAVVAWSTFPSQNAQNTPFSDYFWKLRCRTGARRCGAKHISKSKVQKSEGYGPLLDVQISFFVASAGDCAPCQEWAKREGFVAASTTTTTTLHYTTTTTTTTTATTLITLHYTTLHHTTLHSITLH